MSENPTFASRVKSAWNAFFNKDPTTANYSEYGSSFYYRPDRPRTSNGSERSIVTAVLNRVAIDASAVAIKHVKLDENERYVETVNSDLNNCLTLEANTDQTGRAFIQDAVMSMLDEGCVALVPVDTTSDPERTDSFDIQTIRTGRITQWYPQHVTVEVYNEIVGEKKEITLPKKMVAIIENPLYAVMNAPNSTLQRLIKKLTLLDAIDEKTRSGKLDLIIQLPYVVKGEVKARQAEARRQSIEEQLTGSRYGIAYIDGTEHITQLNRSVDNNLMEQIEYLTSMLYSQLGITKEILEGTADEKTMLNYNNRTIEPILSALTDEMKRKFLTKNARTRGQSIAYFKDPFKLVPVSEISEIADKFTRNEIMTSNEIRQIIGMKPSSDPKADELRNKNLNQSADAMQAEEGTAVADQMVEEVDEELTDDDLAQVRRDSKLEEIDKIDQSLDELQNELDADAESDEEEEDASLKHYVSPYYDPVKAHEYYEEHKKLKGRTKNLNEEGKAAHDYVKKQLTEEKNKRIADSLAARDKKIETSKASYQRKSANEKNRKKIEAERLSAKKEADISQHRDQMNSRIAQLKDGLLAIRSKSGRAKERARIQEEIYKLKEENRAKAAEIKDEYRKGSLKNREDYSNNMTSHREEHKKNVSDARTEYKTAREKAIADYNAKYDQELDKISKEKRFNKEEKKKATSSKSSGGSSSGGTSTSSPTPTTTKKSPGKIVVSSDVVQKQRMKKGNYKWR